MKRGKVIKSEYYPSLIGVVGNVDDSLPNKDGNVMFYPDDEKPFYRIVINSKNIVYIGE